MWPSPAARPKVHSFIGRTENPHDRQLIPKLTKLYDSIFVVRMLYKHV